jgi:hypothetical protein
MTTKTKQALPKLGLGADRFDEMMRKALQVPPPSQEMPGQRKTRGAPDGDGKGQRQGA